jgi:hypothetical protein
VNVTGEETSRSGQSYIVEAVVEVFQTEHDVRINHPFDAGSHPNVPTHSQPDREEITTGPPISPEPAPLQLNRQQFVAGPPMSPEPTRQPDREEITTGPPISPEPGAASAQSAPVRGGATVTGTDTST